MMVQQIDDITIINPGYSLDAVNGPILKDLLKGLVEQQRLKVVIDMAITTFIDSTGCGALLSWLKTMTKNQGYMKIARPTKTVMTVFQLTGLDKIFEIHDSLYSAEKSFT